VSINPFDDDNGSFFVLVNDEEQFLAKPTALRVWTTSNRHTAESLRERLGADGRAFDK
jgi:uncharacterized protein YbdZ (MbtH family)